MTYTRQTSSSDAIFCRQTGVVKSPLTLADFDLKSPKFITFSETFKLRDSWTNRNATHRHRRDPEKWFQPSRGIN